MGSTGCFAVGVCQNSMMGQEAFREQLEAQVRGSGMVQPAGQRGTLVRCQGTYAGVQLFQLLR